MKRFEKIVIAILFIYFLFGFKTTVFAADVFINEFIPNPGTGNLEWVEFYNTTNSTIDLSDYFFDDDGDFASDSGSSAKIALSGLLPSLYTCFWEMPSFLNNNGDSPTLFKIDTTIMDTYTYSSSSAGFSYMRIPDGGEWYFTQTPTKSTSKCIDLAPTPTPTSAPTSTPTPTATKTPTPTLTLTPTQTIIPVVTTPILVTVFASQSAQEILGESSMSAEEKITDIPKKTKINSNSFNFIPFIFVIIGSIAVLIPAAILYPNIKKIIVKEYGKYNDQ